jgi:hypothetical protein
VSVVLYILNILNRNFFIRILLFLVCPIVLVVSVYRVPACALYFVFLGTVVMSLLIVYLHTFRRNELPIILAIMPNAGGPLSRTEKVL